MTETKKLIMSNVDIFQHLVNVHLNNSNRGYFNQFHERVQFKLEAAKYFLERLEKLERTAGNLASASRSEVELNLDAFLYEVVGALDPLLQEINIALGLGSKLKEVNMSNIISKLPKDSHLRNTLVTADRDTQGWFWRLREYRNHSAHRKIIGFNIFIGGTEDGDVYLHEDPLDTKKGRAKEKVMPYCQNSVKRMEYLIDEIYGLCATELSSSKP
jgi:hypothetical protein